MAATPAAAPHSARWLILAVLATGQMLVMLDISIVNTAIPSIARSFQASSSTLQWIVDSYALLFAGLLLLSGALGDRFGRRRLLGLGLLVFIAASIGASLSNTATMLIMMRGVQGVGAAMAMPQTLSILTAVFPREERSRALGLWTAALGLGTAAGPLVGGALVDAIDWSAVFWVPAPVAALAFLGLRIVPESRSEGQQKLDLPGAALGTIAMIALVYGVIEGHGAGWASAEIIAAFGVAGGTAVTFLFVESRAESPIVPLKFFRSRDFNGSLVVLFLTFFALLSVMFFLSQYFQLVQGHSAFQSGLRLLPTAIAMMVTAPIAGRLIPVLGPKILIATAMASAVGVLLFLTQLDVSTPYWQIGVALGIFGMGGGLAMPTVTDTTMAAVPVNEAGRASGVSNAGRQLGGAIGIAALGTLAASLYTTTVGNDLAGLLPAALVDQVADGIGAAAVVARGLDAETAGLVLAATQPAFVDAITTVFLIGSVFMVLALLATLVLIPLRQRTTQMSDGELLGRERPLSTPADLRRGLDMGLARTSPQKVGEIAISQGLVPGD